MKQSNKKFIKKLTRASLLAALYVVLTLFSALFGLSSGAFQLRLSEALCLLPLILPEGVIGLSVGCFLANLITGSHILDIIFGTLATVIGAFFGRALYKKLKLHPFAATLPTLFSNMLIIPLLLTFTYGAEGSYLFFLLSVGAGEFISACLLGTFIFCKLQKSSFLK